MNQSKDAPVVLAVQGLSKWVDGEAGRLTLLDAATFEVKAGESVAVVGPSGSGKSTLLGLLAGLDVPSAGSVHLGGESLFDRDEDGRAALRASRVGFVFQSFQLLPSLTALENVMLPLELRGRRDAPSRAQDWLKRVGLGERVKHYPSMLSGGEQQRVALARAFVSEPTLLLADEPTGSLDSATGMHIADLLFELNASAGTTLILVTHDLQLAARCARRLELQAGVLSEAMA